MYGGFAAPPSGVGGRDPSEVDAKDATLASSSGYSELLKRSMSLSKHLRRTVRIRTFNLISIYFTTHLDLVVKVVIVEAVVFVHFSNVTGGEGRRG